MVKLKKESGGSDNTKKLWSYISIVVPSKNESKNKTKLSGYSDIEGSLFWNDSRIIRIITIIKTIIMIIANNDNNGSNNDNNNDDNNNYY